MATYFVATTGLDTNPGTSGSPFRTIQRGITAATQAGDIVTVANGTYTDTDTATVSITSANAANGAPPPGLPITLKSTNPLGAIIQLPSGTSQRGILVSGRTDWIIDGFDIQGGTATTDANTGIYVEGGSSNRITIRNNHIHNIARTVCSNSTFGNSGIYLTGPASNVIIEDNVLYAIGRRRNGESGCNTNINQHDHGVYAQGTTGLTIRRNVFYDTNRGWALHFYGSTTTSVNVYNNTFADKSVTGTPAGHIILASAWAGTSNIKNNIFSNPQIAPFTTFSISGTGVINIDYNLTDVNDLDWFAAGVPSQVSGGSVGAGSRRNTLPGFVNAAARDYHLVVGSPAINVGVDVGLPFIGTAPDMGAFEFSGAPDTTAPAAPTGLTISS